MQIGFARISISFAFLAIIVFLQVMDKDDDKGAIAEYIVKGYVDTSSESVQALTWSISKYVSGSEYYINPSPQVDGLKLYAIRDDPQRRFGWSPFNASFHPDLDAIFVDATLLTRSGVRSTSTRTPGMRSYGSWATYLDFLVLHELGHRNYGHGSHSGRAEEEAADDFALRLLLTAHELQRERLFELLLNFVEGALLEISQTADYDAFLDQGDHPSIMSRAVSLYGSAAKSTSFTDEERLWLSEFARSLSNLDSLARSDRTVPILLPKSSIPVYAQERNSVLKVMTFEGKIFSFNFLRFPFRQIEQVFGSRAKSVHNVIGLIPDDWTILGWSNNGVCIAENGDGDAVAFNYEEQTIQSLLSTDKAESRCYVGQENEIRELLWDPREKNLMVRSIPISQTGQRIINSFTAQSLGINQYLVTSENSWTWERDMLEKPSFDWWGLTSQYLIIVTKEERDKALRIIGYGNTYGQRKIVRVPLEATVTIDPQSEFIISAVLGESDSSVHIDVLDAKGLRLLRWNVTIPGPKDWRPRRGLGGMTARIGKSVIGISIPGLAFIILEKVSGKVLLLDTWNTHPDVMECVFDGEALLFNIPASRYMFLVRSSTD
ncbi:MAG TPA: hypothetical protein VHP63_06390 [candidate division Zixibacteria bacterium]|nr:hypothetical protein [candidate division Zixibacteria bacterium]